MGSAGNSASGTGSDYSVGTLCPNTRYTTDSSSVVENETKKNGLQPACLYTRDSGLDPQRHIKLSMVMHACNPNTPAAEAERSEVQAHPKLWGESQDRIAYRRPC